MYVFDEDSGEWVDDGVSDSIIADTGLETPSPGTDSLFGITEPNYTGVGSTAGNAISISDLVSKLTSGKISRTEIMSYVKATPTRAAGVVGGLMGAFGNTSPNIQKVGFQGAIPRYTATRAAVPYAPNPNRRPGSGGRQYFTDVALTPKGSADAAAAAQADVQAKAQALAAQGLAHGGIAGLASGRYLQGPTDGMADDLPASIDDQEPAKLSHGEFVIPADVVSHLGNGNSDAGAKKLYQMMDKIRVARTGTKEQGKQINPDKFMPGGAVGYSSGGGIKAYAAGDLVDTTRPTYESNLSNWAGPYVTDMLGKGQALSEMPYQAYQGPLTAGPSALQTQAFNQASGLSVPPSIGQAATTAGNIAGKMQGLNYQPAQVNAGYTAPGAYQAGEFAAGTFGAPEAQQYMNPYLQAALNPQLEEARRQSEISKLADRTRLTQAGAYGGGRQAIMESEANRNLATNLANITGTGYNTAYQQAMAQFNADQARKQQAQQLGEQSRQFGYGQQANAAQLAAQFGLTAQQAQEASRQFGANYGLQGLQGALSAAQAQGALGTQESQLGLANLAQMANLGATQRGIESEGVAADKAQFEEARDYPYKMVQYQQSLLGGLPLATQGTTTAQANALQAASGGADTVINLLTKLGLIK